MKKLILFTSFILALASHPAYAAHPLITDDTGTQGTGKVQIEINGEYRFDKERESGVTEKERGGNIAATITVGVHERVDVIVGVPYNWFTSYQDGRRVARENGIGDMNLDVKWRFFDQNGWSFAVKPGITLPSGDADRDLGNGRVGYKLFFITTKELAPWAFHLNLGYIRNENKFGDERNIWHASLAAEYEIVKNLKIVGNVGAERNGDINDHTPPVFALGGLIYQVSEQFSIDGGIKVGLTKPETDLSFLFGMTMKF
jgi:hypothetical protein